MSASMNFQHSQPQSVYRPKDRFMGLLAGAMLSGISLYWAYDFIREPGFLTIINVPIWLWWAYRLAKNAHLNRIVMSPAGISVTHGRSAATAWSNVERLQVLTVGTTVKVGEVPCLVLREPAEGDMTPITRGVPDELKGRIIPLFPFQWARIAEMEQELYHYLPGAESGPLAVPPSLAAISRRQERFTQRILLGIVIVLGLVVFWMLRGIIW